MGNCIGPERYRCPHCHLVISDYERTNHRCGSNNQRKFQSQPPAIQAVSQPKKPLQNNNYKKEMAFLKPKFPAPCHPIDQTRYKGLVKQSINDTLDLKVPENPERTTFKWVRSKAVFYPPFITNFNPENMRNRTFQQKMLWFRLHIEKLRVSWQEGCEFLNVDRANLVFSSKAGLGKVNLRKQLKIRFDDEVVDDAGGLLREWIHLILKEIFSQKTGVFVQCKTQETAYKFVWDKDLDQVYATEYIQTLGIILGKAMFERVSIDCYLCRTIWRQIASQPILMCDMFSFDEDLYKSWNDILEMNGSQNLFLTMSELKIWNDKSTTEIELKKNGKNIEVNDENKHEYIFALMTLYSTKSVLPMVQAILKGIYKVIPPGLLSVFDPHEFEMMVNGPQTIDVNDWRNNTVYKGYKYNDPIITWFWSYVQKFDQKKLGILLHYCTGTKRVPILGFKYLESNRNTVCKFTIEKSALNQHNPYPRSYTCFNRLQLPEYHSKMELEQKMNVILAQEITHFGLG